MGSLMVQPAPKSHYFGICRLFRSLVYGIFLYLSKNELAGNIYNSCWKLVSVACFPKVYVNYLNVILPLPWVGGKLSA